MLPSERKALLFLAAVVALGVGTRAARSLASDVPSAPEARAALARQIAAVDSARAAKRSTKSRTTRPRGGGTGRAGKPRGGPAEPAGVIDLDRADSAAIEGLPRIGPALARRIVADRDSNGPFGSLAGLERVRGIGPKVARTLAPHVTFSGTPRLTGAAYGGARLPVNRRPRAPVRPRRRSGRVDPQAGGGRTGGGVAAGVESSPRTHPNGRLRRPELE